MEQVTIRVPATTANLAAGFDVLGCALGLYNTLSFTPSDELSFSGCEEQYQNEQNLAYVAYARVWQELRRGDVPPVHIHIQSEIPVCRGLGSSAALIAAGAAAANYMAGKPFDRRQLLAMTTEIEGHPDNLAPALLGGMTASMMAGRQVYTVEYLPHPELHFVALSPDFPLSTHEARRALPAMVSHSDAVRNSGYLAVLLRALEQGDEELIAVSLQDRLHQPYRRRLIPEYDRVEATRTAAARYASAAPAPPFCASPATGTSPRGWSAPYCRWSTAGRCGIFPWITTAPSVCKSFMSKKQRGCTASPLLCVLSRARLTLRFRLCRAMIAVLKNR